MQLLSEKSLRNMIRYAPDLSKFIIFTTLVDIILYLAMTSFALNLLLQVHCSENGKHFKSKLRAEHVELLQSPRLIELGAFYLNLEGSDGGELNELSSHFSCDLDATPPMMALILPDSLKIEYDLTCAICLVRKNFQLCCKGQKASLHIYVF